MKVELVLPALTEARSPLLPARSSTRCSRRSGSPPWPAFLEPDDEVRIQDEHVDDLDLDDDPDLVVIEVYVTSARRAYAIADRYRRRGARTWSSAGCTSPSLPDEAARHADTIVLGPAEEAWPRFLADFRAGRPQPVYRSRDAHARRAPPPCAATSSAAISTSCPTRSWSRAAARTPATSATRTASSRADAPSTRRPVDEALAEIERLPGRHLYFLDDHLFGASRLRRARSSTAMRGMGRLWQAAGTVDSVLRPGLLEKAVACGLRSLFVGFETLEAGEPAQRSASARIWARTTRAPSAGCTTSASW